jgi:hypothetical protein
MNTRVVALGITLGVLALTASAQDDVAPPQYPYPFLIDVNVLPTEKSAHVSLTIGEGAAFVRKLTFRIDPERHLLFEGDGRIVTEAPDKLAWEPPIEGGTIRYVFRIDHLRDDAQYDSRSSSSWALFRGRDLVPPVATVARAGAFSVTKLRLRLPDKWEAVLPFPQDETGHYIIENPRRDFDRPTGWFLVGKIGIEHERIAGVDVTVASPKGRSSRRLDTIALLRWTLPKLAEIVDLPPRIAIVSAGDPMWRGGLSGPNSIYVHNDRPLIDEDFTSPLLHELIHTVMAARAGKDGDWVVEGLAELYALELLVRSGTIAPEKRALAFDRMSKKAKNAGGLATSRADAPTTARGVLVLRDLDAEIQRRTENRRSLDDVLRELVIDREVLTTAHFLSVVNRVGESDYTAFLRGRGAMTSTKVPSGTKRPPR